MEIIWKPSLLATMEVIAHREIEFNIKVQVCIAFWELISRTAKSNRIGLSRKVILEGHVINYEIVIFRNSGLNFQCSQLSISLQPSFCLASRESHLNISTGNFRFLKPKSLVFVSLCLVISLAHIYEGRIIFPYLKIFLIIFIEKGNDRCV